MKKLISFILGLLFQIWFVSSIVGVFYCGQNGMFWMAAAIIGQFFLVFWLIAVLTGVKEK